MHHHRPILIVEDDPIIARALYRALSLAGYTGLLVTNRADGAKQEGPFAAAIVDIHLPDGSGLELFDELRRRSVVTNAIFFSATTDRKEITLARKAGTFVPKSDGVRCALEALLPLLVAEDEPPESETRSSTPRLPVTAPSKDDVNAK